MRINDLLADESVLLGLRAKSKEEVWEVLAKTLHANGSLTNTYDYLADVKSREEKGTTGVGFGVAIPHAKSQAVIKPALAFARMEEAISVESLDGSNADLFFLIAAPLDGQDIHLQALAKLARMLVHGSFLQSLRQAESVKEIKEIIANREG